MTQRDFFTKPVTLRQLIERDEMTRRIIAEIEAYLATPMRDAKDH